MEPDRGPAPQRVRAGEAGKGRGAEFIANMGSRPKAPPVSAAFGGALFG